MEKHTHRLLDIEEYLVALKYAKARDHRDEVADFKEVLDICSEEVFTVLHQRQVANPTVPVPLQAAAQPPRASVKPSASELKPENLTHDTSASTFHTLPCSQQQAYLCNCVDTVLRARIDRKATGTTPAYSPIVGLYTCIAILDNTFLEEYPIQVRCKQFFDARQKDGQSAIEFREELLSLLEEADGANIGCDDLICMMLQIGLTDGSLRRELGAVRNPNLASFSEKIEGFEQARRTEPDSAYGNAVSRGNQNSAPNRRTSGQGGQPPNRNTPPRGRERDRRLALRSKCFRCAKADHMIPACTYPDSVKCNLCGAVGHVIPACGHRQVAQMAQHIPSSPSSPPASSS